MRTDIDTRILEKLTERVERLCREYNDPNTTGMGKDWAWTELTHEALPDLEEYLNGGNFDHLIKEEDDVPHLVYINGDVYEISFHKTGPYIITKNDKLVSISSRGHGLGIYFSTIKEAESRLKGIISGEYIAIEL